MIESTEVREISALRTDVGEQTWRSSVLESPRCCEKLLGANSERSGTSSSCFGGPRALRSRFHGGFQAPRDFKIRSITSSWCGEVRAEITFISSPHELHKLGFSNHTLAINLAQFLRLTLANWLSSSSMTTTSLGACGVSSFFIHPSSRRIVVEIAP